MKVTKAIGSEGETYSELDLELPAGTSAKLARKVKNDVGDFLVEQVLSAAAEARSAVAGEAFPPLSKAYKKKKIAEGGTGKPDMTLEGDMMDDLTFKYGDGDKIKLGLFSSQAWKADGHLKFSGEENNTPKRRFLPAEGQTFKSAIEGEVEKIIADVLVDDGVDASAFEDVETTAELYAVLRGLFPEMGKAEIRGAVLRSAIIPEMLDELGILGLL